MEKMAKGRYLNEIESELQKKQELEKRFEQLKQREEELISLYENSNSYEKQAMNELKTLLYGTHDDGNSANKSMGSRR